MTSKIQHQFLLSTLKKDSNKKGPIPLKINPKKIERVEINLNLNNSFSNEFSTMPKEEVLKDDSNNLLAQSYSFSQINKFREKILNEPSTIILESILYSKQNGGKSNLNRKIKFITPKDASGLFAKLLNKNKENNEEYLKLRNIILNENDIKNFFKDNFNQPVLQKLYKQIVNLNYSINKYFNTNNVNPIISLKKLFEVISLNNPNNTHLNYNEKYNKLKPIIHRCRQIKGDGNCYYRVVMFRYFEQIILSKNLILLKKIILEMNQAFKSKEIQDRLYIKMDVNFRPKLHLNIMYLILNLLEANKIKESYELFVKCILSCAIFDYGLILYFRYILYLYIKNNEKKLYTKSFPVKIGNFLPAKYEKENGEFEYQKFYSNYLLKMFTEAEKIIIYLTPFVLGVDIDIIIFEDNEDKIVKKFSYEEENGEKKQRENVITLLNRNAHYELVYTFDEYNKYSELYNICEIFDSNNDDKNLGNSYDNNYFLFQNNLKLSNYNKGNNIIDIKKGNNYENKINNSNKNSKTVIIQKRQKNNVNIVNIDSNKNVNKDILLQNNKHINDANNGAITKLVNKDNNEDKIPKEQIITHKMKPKSENEIPFGHPEYKVDNSIIQNYLDEIDNMFLNNIPYIECLKCKKKEANSIQDKYDFCNNCLQNEIIYSLANDYSNYLKTENIRKKKYKITSIKLDKYILNINDILETLRIFVDLFEEKDLYQYLKQYVCLSCLKPIDIKINSKIKFPCGCGICNKDELEKYFTEQNINLTDNYTCLCGYKYQPKDYYSLAEECYKFRNISICLMIINIFHKEILSKGCCGCGKKNKDIEIKYKAEKSDDNEFLIENYLKANLMHYFCKSCAKKFKNQKFVCFYCNKVHIYISE